MAKRKAGKIMPQKSDDSKMFAFLATFLSIVGFVIAIIAKKEDKYVMFYAKQSLVLFIALVIFSIIGQILWIVPIISRIIYAAIEILFFIGWLVSWIYALSGEMKEIPIIGQYGRKFNF